MARLQARDQEDHWEWDVGAKALTLRGDSIFYAFVDLKWSELEPPLPDVFIVVPSATVADFLGSRWRRYMFWIMEGTKTEYFERWDRITERLVASNGMEGTELRVVADP